MSMLPRLFVLGDSISIQYGPHLRKMLHAKFEYDRKGGSEATLADPIHASGPNGGDSSNVLAYLQQRQSQSPIQADYIAFNCGLHDIKCDLATGAHQVPIEQYRLNLTLCLDHIMATAAEPIWIRTTPVDDQMHNSCGLTFNRYEADVERYNAVADEVMSASGVGSIDLHGFTRSLEGDLFCDHVHYAEPVRKLQAAHIAGWVIAFHAARR
jgi:hypothetical protein